MSSVTKTLIDVEQNTIRYGFPVLLVLANLGNLLVICIFTQKHHRQNPCSLYLLTSAFTCLIGANVSLITNLNGLYQNPDPFQTSLILCCLRSYIQQVTLALQRSMIIFACFDRFALSSQNPRIRALSNKALAIKLILSILLSLLLITIHQPFFQTIQSNRCSIGRSYGLFFSIYQIIFFGFLFPGLMMVFGILLWKNLRNIRFRSHRVQTIRSVEPVTQYPLLKRDIRLIKFVLAEVVVAVALNFLYPINTLYGVLTYDTTDKTADRLQIERFMTFIIELCLLCLNYSVTFYLYLIMCRSFRTEVGNFLCKYTPCHPRHRRIIPAPVVSFRLTGHSNQLPTSANRDQVAI